MVFLFHTSKRCACRHSSVAGCVCGHSHLTERPYALSSASRTLAARFLHGERLLDEMHALVQHAVVGDDIGRVAGHEQALEVRDRGTAGCSARSRPFISGMTTSVMSRWIFAGVLLGQADGLARRGGGQHGVAQASRASSWSFPGWPARPPPAGWSRGRARPEFCRPSVWTCSALPTMPGQVDLEGRSLARLAVDIDEAVVLLDDAVDRGQPQAGALAHLLGGEERLEELCQRLLVHAAAVVADGQQHILAGDKARRGRRSRPRRR